MSRKRFTDKTKKETNKCTSYLLSASCQALGYYCHHNWREKNKYELSLISFPSNLIWSLTPSDKYIFRDCVLVFSYGTLLFLRRRKNTSMSELPHGRGPKNKRLLYSLLPPCRCETQVFLACQTKPQLCPTQSGCRYF